MTMRLSRAHGLAFAVSAFTVIARAGADSTFRRQLPADPKGTLQVAYGLELPPDCDMQVLEQTPSKFYLVLPVQTDQLTDEQLDAVAGRVGLLYSGPVSVAFRKDW